ncbi:MAG: hypothetical protein K9M10_00425 [Candidatus Pacebacteria bacterium]|nr:hypothetical protein [Candidatus Paceibacterota bacterium]MCF7856927.1 hypothetical protein [Candidatus Paceibacterota bacterium]
MNSTNHKTEWENYCAQELEVLNPLLAAHGYILDAEQKHLQGERYLMQAVTTSSGRKLILTGVAPDMSKVIIKATRESGGKHEIKHERLCRDFLQRIDFAGEVFHSPQEVAFINERGFTITIQRFIDQPCSFLDRSIEEQFSLALRAFKGQESAHATTSRHQKSVTRIYGIRTADSYIQTFTNFNKNISSSLGDSNDICVALTQSQTILKENIVTIDQYCNFLTHTDFVPHNIRINDDTIYLLDHSSLTFGNKYEGWARFINFMTLYNPPLQRALETYVRDNRAPEEFKSLRLMRIYRLGEIIWYYTRSLKKSNGPLFELNTTRIQFWGTVLSCVLEEKDVPQSIISAYTKKRDSLRSNEEISRQKGLH